MKVSIDNQTGLMIESSSSSTDATLIDNAVSMGYLEADIEVRSVDDAEHRAFIETRALANQPASTTEQIIAQYKLELDNHLDSVAHRYRYTDRITFSLRAGYAGPYHVEGLAFAQWMDACNVQAYTLLQGVLSGVVAIPTVDDFIAELPEFVMPV